MAGKLIIYHFEARSLRTKTITRFIRPLKDSQQLEGTWSHSDDGMLWVQRSPVGAIIQTVDAPFAPPGDTVFAAEWWAYSANRPGKILFRSDRPTTKERVDWKQGSSLREADARFNLRIVEISLRRLHAISENEARQTGAVYTEGLGWRHSFGTCRATPKASLESAWLQAGIRPSWSKNPWVWSVEVIPQRRKLPVISHQKKVDLAYEV